ncbi:MAG: GNAT family N-acetyltransferase [Bacteroidota bacterium]|nr:GNAT family N-acetyltransferase [Bacteroidota bacterium]
MEGFLIKKVDTKDVHLLREVALKAYADHYLDLWYDDGQWYMNKYFSIEKLSEELSDENSRFFIAFIDEQPVGFLKLNINAPLESFKEKNALELERIYLNKEVTGKRIGKELVELSFKISKENNKDIVWLKAMDTSEGPIAFYKKMGFKIIGTHQLKHALMKEDVRGMVVMIKEITSK